jgi:hypothetical protein
MLCSGLGGILGASHLPKINYIAYNKTFMTFIPSFPALG